MLNKKYRNLHFWVFKNVFRNHFYREIDYLAFGIDIHEENVERFYPLEEYR